jgi:hypothetical protein
MRVRPIITKMEMQLKEESVLRGGLKGTKGTLPLPRIAWSKLWGSVTREVRLSCSWVHESDIATSIADDLATVESHSLAEALLDVLLQFSRYQETARQIVEGTSIFSSLIRVVQEFKCRLTSALLPSLLDLLWNLLDTMPKPRTLPNQVCVCGVVSLCAWVLSIYLRVYPPLASSSAVSSVFAAFREGNAIPRLHLWLKVQPFQPQHSDHLQSLCHAFPSAL